MKIIAYITVTIFMISTIVLLISAFGIIWSNNEIYCKILLSSFIVDILTILIIRIMDEEQNLFD